MLTTKAPTVGLVLAPSVVTGLYHWAHLQLALLSAVHLHAPELTPISDLECCTYAQGEKLQEQECQHPGAL